MPNDVSCDDCMLAVMVLGDGEAPDVSPDDIESHLVACESCQTWSAELADITSMLEGCRRQDDSHDLWPALAPSIVPQRAHRYHDKALAPFVVLVAALVGYRFVLLAAPGPELALKLLAIVLIVAAFAVARENPFRIETERELGTE